MTQIVNKAIILAGGTGTRLKPVTNIINKHLLLIYNKPMIYYPLSTCMLGGIKNFLIISNPTDVKQFKTLLGNGSRLGIKISYEIQKKAAGIPEAFIIGEKFIKKDPICLMLGDNILFGSGLPDILSKSFKNFHKSKLFIQTSSNPQDYGVVHFNKKNMKPKYIIEKPKNPKSNYVAIGLYLYSNDVIQKSKKLTKSLRNELEISDLNNTYLKEKNLELEDIGRGIAWFDAGDADRIMEASNFISLIEKKQGNLIGCIEEVSLKMGFISKNKYISNISFFKNSTYEKILKKVIL
ncbi:MAG: sugar phosphate nucleotidyltransferase [Alphaproteobacteria bacterium]|nr:sugar phosphate nucleotidyltransferase [Alphaproteobacteria bacterium]